MGERRSGVPFEEFFARATSRLGVDGFGPYPFQRRFAEQLPKLVHVPTGLGKTAMVILGWLWRRRFAPPNLSAGTPRRLVYCLPMRVLVEQTVRNTEGWLDTLKRQDLLTDDIGVHVLMGGEDESEWDLYPEREVILIGTQDMLLSRALNRGYAASRARWPLQFGQLHTDCLWVFDEIQLMGSGLATTAQLDAFRSTLPNPDAPQALASHGCRSVWMSATLDSEWLRTVDCDPNRMDPALGLSADDLQNENVQRRRLAMKQLTRAASVNSDSSGLAAEILASHEKGTRTLVVVNTVARARALFAAVAKRAGSGAAPDTVLLHSRFRPFDRKRQVDRVLAEPGEMGSIIVSTQVVEAGVDLSAKHLFTEVAPWASLVQRFGRCNRSGEYDLANVHWIDLDGLEGDGKASAKASAPYSTDALLLARNQLAELEGRSVGLDTLDDLGIELPFEHTHVLRRKDLVELFDTTPDLAGNDLDIDRYVRDVDDTDVRVFWRELRGNRPGKDATDPGREELCPAPIGEFKAFVEKLRKVKLHAYRRNFLDGAWELVGQQCVPGQVYLLDCSSGGYDPSVGWTGIPARKTKDHAPVAEGPALQAPGDSDAADKLSGGVWQTIAEHTQDVVAELEGILQALPVAEADALRVAARWHDWGKAHTVFQSAIDDGETVPRRRGAVTRRPRPVEWQGCRFVAKAPNRAKRNVVVDPGFWRRYDWDPERGRKHFRHELASALGYLAMNPHSEGMNTDLATYLIAAHHGKVRLSIRSFPGEIPPANDRRFARGVWNDDALPETDLGGGVMAPETTISLEPMELGLCQEPPFTGTPSWLDRMLRLREALGPFQLAWLEALLRAADMRASAGRQDAGS